MSYTLDEGLQAHAVGIVTRTVQLLTENIISQQPLSSRSCPALIKKHTDGQMSNTCRLLIYLTNHFLVNTGSHMKETQLIFGYQQKWTLTLRAIRSTTKLTSQYSLTCSPISHSSASLFIAISGDGAGGNKTGEWLCSNSPQEVSTFLPTCP